MGLEASEPSSFLSCVLACSLPMLTSRRLPVAWNEFRLAVPWRKLRAGSGGFRHFLGAGCLTISLFICSCSLSSAFSYGVASMAMVFVNKAVVMQYVHSMTLLTLQQLATALFIHFGKFLECLKGKISTWQQRSFSVSIFYNANVAFALVSLSVVCTALGVLVAALGDFSFDLYGYSMALISVFFQTMYLILVEKSGADDGLSSMELMFYNSILSIPFLFFIIVATGEFPHSLSVLSEKTASASFSVILLISLVMGIVLNYTMFWCTIVNSALTTTIVGVLKGVGSTTLGFVVLGGVKVHALNVTGLVINTFGGVWYSYAKYTLKKRLPRKVEPDEESHPHK
ncbi:hypothetical protein ZWY2020_053900 [Hordeum vulgare]|nr:hypothetical protein ZWY2020_053900 [Hordeum vulgare]